MPAVYADHPFDLIPTTSFPRVQNGEPVRTSPSLPTPTNMLTLPSQIDTFHRLSSEMALVHNLILRSLNAIVLQAPHITGADIAPFTRFILAWHTMITIHHSGEEALFFPAVERMSGVVGVMDKEKGEHEEFHAGLDALKGYVDAVVKGEEAWDGGRVVEVVEGFGGVLRGHLSGEVQSLEGLRRFGEERMSGVLKAAEEEAEAGMVSLFLSFSQVFRVLFLVF